MRMANKPKKPWTIMLFSLPFAGIGLGFLLFSVIPSLYEGLQMSDWPEAQATVISSELKSYSGDSTTYEALGLYHYQVAGQHYAGTRLGISRGADNVGDWHQQMSGKMRSARSSQTAMSIYFNPDNPAVAFVDRAPRWDLLGFKMIFVLVFGGVGVGLFYWAMRDHNKFIDTPAAADQPWLAHKDWASATIRSDSSSRPDCLVSRQTDEPVLQGWNAASAGHLLARNLPRKAPDRLAKSGVRRACAFLEGPQDLPRIDLEDPRHPGERSCCRIDATSLELDLQQERMGFLQSRVPGDCLLIHLLCTRQILRSLIQAPPVQGELRALTAPVPPVEQR
jgi:hypothetical protein